MKKTRWIADDRQTMSNERFEIFYNYTDIPFQAPFHSHDFYEIVLFKKGHARFSVEGITYTLKSGDLLVSSPQELHRVEILDAKVDYERYILWIHPRFLDDLMRLQNQFDFFRCFDATKKQHYHVIHPGTRLLQEIERIGSHLLSSDPLWQTKIMQDCLMCELLVLVNMAYENTSLVENEDYVLHPKLNDVVFYIHHHLSDDLTLDTLAKHFFISKYHLSHLVREYMPMSLHQYILEKRLNVARSLLEKGVKPNDAAMEVGFVNYTHFSNAFKTQFGFSPKKWIDLYKKEKKP